MSDIKPFARRQANESWDDYFKRLNRDYLERVVWRRQRRAINRHGF